MTEQSQEQQPEPSNSVTNVSGGVNANAERIDIDGDVVGRDKIETNTTVTKIITNGYLVVPLAVLGFTLVMLAAIILVLILRQDKGTQPFPDLTATSLMANAQSSLTKTPTPYETPATLPQPITPTATRNHSQALTVTPPTIETATPVPPTLLPIIQTPAPNLTSNVRISPENAKNIRQQPVWDVGTYVFEATWLPGETHELAAASYGVPIYDVSKLQLTRTIVANNWVTQMAISSDGKLLVSLPAEPLQIWDIFTGGEIRTFSDMKSVSRVSFSPDGKMLAAAINQAVELLDIEKGTEVDILGLGARVEFLAFSPTTPTLAMGSYSVVELWNYVAGNKLITIEPVQMQSIAFSPDGHALAVGTNRGISLYDATSGRLLRVIEGTESPKSLSYSPDGKLIAAATGLLIDIVDVQTGQKLQTLKGHTNNVTSVAFSPDGTTLASAAYPEEFVRLWAVNSVQPAP